MNTKLPQRDLGCSQPGQRQPEDLTGEVQRHPLRREPRRQGGLDVQLLRRQTARRQSVARPPSNMQQGSEVVGWVAGVALPTQVG